jgi:HK97 family phage portal protein
MPAKVFRREATGGKTEDTAPPAHALVHGDANPWTSAVELRTRLTADALLHGGGYAFANRVNGRVVEFIRLRPETVTELVDDVTGEPAFRVTEKGGERLYRWRDILVVRPFGASPVRLAREAIGLALVLEQHAARLFARGGRPSGLLSSDQTLNEGAAARMKASWQAATGGSNSGGTAILEQGMKFQQLALTSVDAQFAEMRVFQINEIARAFNVPGHMLKEMSTSTWSNNEQANLEFLQFTLQPWLDAWVAAYRRVLFDENDATDFVIEFITDALLRADTATRSEAFAKWRSMGVMTANEVRARENLPALPGGDKLENPYTTSAKAPSNG